jgi:hypothetical protein
MRPDSRDRLKQWLVSGEARLYPLSFSQRELWENSPVPAEDAANHISSIVEIKGALTEKEAVAALQRVVDRQEALRTSFLPGKERPLQLVRARATANVRYRELSKAELQPEGLSELLKQNSSVRFDLMHGPLYRADLLRRSATDHLLIFSIHHAIADGWSLGVFVQDLCAAYLTAAPLPRLAQSYAECSAAERALWKPAELDSRAHYWRNKLAGARQLLPPDAAAERMTQPLERWTSLVVEDLTASVRELSRRHKATLFSTLLAAFELTLFKWSGEDDLVVGAPVANRSTAASRETIGYFSAVVPLRNPVDRKRTLAEHFAFTHDGAVDGFANAMPFAEISRALGEPRGRGVHCIFDVRFALHNHPVPDVVVPGFATSLRMRSSGTARFDLACEIVEVGKQLEVVWLFRSPTFSATTIAEIHRLFLNVLTKTCFSPESQVSGL